MIVDISGFFLKPSGGVVLLHRFRVRIRMHVRPSTSLLLIGIPEVFWMGGEPSCGSETVLQEIEVLPAQVACGGAVLLEVETYVIHTLLVPAHGVATYVEPAIRFGPYRICLIRRSEWSCRRSKLGTCILHHTVRGQVLECWYILA